MTDHKFTEELVSSDSFMILFEKIFDSVIYEINNKLKKKLETDSELIKAIKSKNLNNTYA
jgi:hypothetical protein